MLRFFILFVTIPWYFIYIRYYILQCVLNLWYTLQFIIYVTIYVITCYCTLLSTLLYTVVFTSMIYVIYYMLRCLPIYVTVSHSIRYYVCYYVLLYFIIDALHIHCGLYICDIRHLPYAAVFTYIIYVLRFLIYVTMYVITYYFIINAITYCGLYLCDIRYFSLHAAVFTYRIYTLRPLLTHIHCIHFSDIKFQATGSPERTRNNFQTWLWDLFRATRCSPILYIL